MAEKVMCEGCKIRFYFYESDGRIDGLCYCEDCQDELIDCKDHVEQKSNLYKKCNSYFERYE